MSSVKITWRATCRWRADRHIATVDSDGVALAAIQGLNAKVEAENRALKQEIAELKRMVRELGARTAGSNPHGG